MVLWLDYWYRFNLDIVDKSGYLMVHFNWNMKTKDHLITGLLMNGYFKTWPVTECFSTNVCKQDKWSVWFVLCFDQGVTITIFMKGLKFLNYCEWPKYFTSWATQYSCWNIKRTKEKEYSRHPNTEPPSVFGFILMPVPIIRISDHLKSGQKCPNFEWLA